MEWSLNSDEEDTNIRTYTNICQSKKSNLTCQFCVADFGGNQILRLDHHLN
jgi:hypothetical protein